MGGNGPSEKDQRPLDSLGKDCSSTEIVAVLQSPRETTLSRLRLGDLLGVIYFENKVLIINNDDEVVGSITGKNMAQLASCIIKKHNYQAEIVQINGGNCKVKITHK